MALSSRPTARAGTPRRHIYFYSRKSQGILILSAAKSIHHLRSDKVNFVIFFLKLSEYYQFSSVHFPFFFFFYYCFSLPISSKGCVKQVMSHFFLLLGCLCPLDCLPIELGFGYFSYIFTFHTMPGVWPEGLFRGINTHGFGKGIHLDSWLGFWPWPDPSQRNFYLCSLTADLPCFAPGLLSLSPHFLYETTGLFWALACGMLLSAGCTFFW